tara:strand:- start:12292 stop:14037 length:1746 start_codon:yes stop_codon:yes gene_type:complete
MGYSSNKTPTRNISFPENSPSYTKGNKSYVGFKGNIGYDSMGNPVSLIPKPPPNIDTSGELLKLQKKHYGNNALSSIIDSSFSELTKTKDEITPESFFVMYRDLFYSIPKVGKESHTTLIEESTAYVGNYQDSRDSKIDGLLDKVIELEQASISTPSEHPLFRNGTAIRAGGRLGIMQEGHLRRVSNSGGSSGPSPYSSLKRTLGLVDANGNILDDEKSWTRVNEQTWDSLPKWPNPTQTRIGSTADWSLSLASFNPAASNITLITTEVQEAELDEFEINSLIELLTDKTPFLGNTIEDNFNGTLSWSDEDLMPFGYKGEYEGQQDAFNKKLNTGMGIDAYINSIIQKHAQTADKGIYNLNTDSYITERTIYFDDNGNITSLNPFNLQQYNLFEARNVKVLKTDHLEGLSTNISFEYDHEAIDELLALKAEFQSSDNVEDHPIVRYAWAVDFERNDLYGIDDAKLYWVKDVDMMYRNYAVARINMAVGELRQILTTYQDVISYELNHVYGNLGNSLLQVEEASNTVGSYTYYNYITGQFQTVTNEDGGGVPARNTNVYNIGDNNAIWSPSLNTPNYEPTDY